MKKIDVEHQSKNTLNSRLCVEEICMVCEHKPPNKLANESVCLISRNTLAS